MIAGMRLFGLIFRNSGLNCSPFEMLIGFTVYGRPISSRATLILRPFGVFQVHNSIGIGMTFRWREQAARILTATGTPRKPKSGSVPVHNEPRCSMPACVIAEHIITDPARFEEYRTAVGPMMAKYGGRYLTKGGTHKMPEGGHWSPEWVVIIEFPDITAVDAWYN